MKLYPSSRADTYLATQEVTRFIETKGSQKPAIGVYRKPEESCQ
jgi:hypothetical protein